MSIESPYIPRPDDRIRLTRNVSDLASIPLDIGTELRVTTNRDNTLTVTDPSSMATHRLVLELAAGGSVDGLRIDHPDGLADPAGYFRRLPQRYAERAGLGVVAGYTVINDVSAPKFHK